MINLLNILSSETPDMWWLMYVTLMYVNILAYPPNATVVYVKGEANYSEKDSHSGKDRHRDKELLREVPELLNHHGLVCWRTGTCWEERNLSKPSTEMTDSAQVKTREPERKDHRTMTSDTWAHAGKESEIDFTVENLTALKSSGEAFQLSSGIISYFCTVRLQNHMERRVYQQNFLTDNFS